MKRESTEQENFTDEQASLFWGVGGGGGKINRNTSKGLNVLTSQHFWVM